MPGPSVTPARPDLNSWDVLKLMALGLMFVDHVAIFFFPDALWMRAIGRCAMPMFLFLVGYASSYKIHKDIVYISIAMTAWNWCITHDITRLHILYDIIAARWILQRLERPGRPLARPWETFGYAFACFIPSILLTGYGSIAILFALCGYFFKHRDEYAATFPERYMAVCFVLHAAFTFMAFSFSIRDEVLVTIGFVATYYVLSHIKIRPVHMPAGGALRFIARRSLYIYALHVAIFQIVTGKPF